MSDPILHSSSLSQLQACATELEFQKHELDNNLSNIYAQIIKLKNRDAPISRMPAEVILSIFRAGHAMKNDPKVQFQVLVSHVIRPWREIVLLDPSLWNTIVVLPCHSPETIQDFLHRSQDRRLTVRLAYSSNEWPRHFIRIMELLSAHAYRWQEFHVDAADQQLMHRIIRSLKPLEVPHLEKVKIQLKDHNCEEFRNTNMVVFSGGAPRLSHISLIGISPFHFSPQWETDLVKFRLGHRKAEPLFYNVGQFHRFLLNVPPVTCLVFEGFIVEGSTIQQHLEVLLPYLRRLVIDGSHVPIAGPACFTTIIKSTSLPKLESLVLANGTSEALHELFTGIGLSLASLKRLELRDTLWQGLTAEIMHQIPALTHLSLIRCNAPSILRHLRDAATPVPWPNLRNLAIEIEARSSEDSEFAPAHINADDEFTELICGVVVARELVGAPITRLHLNFDLLGRIPDGRKAWLRGEGVELVHNGFSTFDSETVMNDP